MGVRRVYRVGSPYNAVELSELDVEQTYDTMYMAHLDHPPGKLVRLAHDDWRFETVTFGPDVAAPAGCSAVPHIANTDSDNDGNGYFPQPATYCVTAVSKATGQESRGSNTSNATNDLSLKRNYNAISWSAVAGAERYNIYKAHNTQFFGYIGTTAGLSFIDDNIGPALDKAPPRLDDPFAKLLVSPATDSTPAVYDTGNYPSSVTFFEQRLVLGRTRNKPNGIWASRSAEFENFDVSTPLRADDAIALGVVAGRVNAVNQLVSTTQLLALTSDSLFVIDGDGAGGVLTATSQAVRRQIGRGSSRLSPLVVDNVVFYQPSVGSGVRSIGYSIQQDGLTSADVSIFSPHLFDGHSIVSWAYAQEPRSLIWAARDDGKLLCFTWEQEQQVTGWTLCETDGAVRSLCVISEEGEDRLYLVVERMIGGVKRSFIERMAPSSWEHVEDACFLDCAVSAEFETPQSSFSGLWHLEGRSDVAGLADGMVVTGLSVAGGKIVLPETAGAARRVTFGLAYQVDVETLPLRFMTEGIGSNVGRRQQVGEIVLDLHRSRSVLAGVDRDHLLPVKSRSAESWGDPDALITGQVLLDSANVVSGEAKVHVRQTAPLPLTLLGVSLDPIVGG